MSSTTSGTMSTTISSYSRASVARIHGVPGAAVRVGRLLELWGRRAAGHSSRSELQLRRQLEWRAEIALASRAAAETRAAYQPIR